MLWNLHSINDVMPSSPMFLGMFSVQFLLLNFVWPVLPNAFCFDFRFSILLSWGFSDEPIGNVRICLKHENHVSSTSIQFVLQIFIVSKLTLKKEKEKKQEQQPLTEYKDRFSWRFNHWKILLNKIGWRLNMVTDHFIHNENSI